MLLPIIYGAQREYLLEMEEEFKYILTIWPRTHIIFFVPPVIGKVHMVELAQLVRALVCGTRGRGFDSHIPPHLSCFVGEGIPNCFRATGIRWGVAKW